MSEEKNKERRFSMPVSGSGGTSTRSFHATKEATEWRMQENVASNSDEGKGDEILKTMLNTPPSPHSEK